MINSVVHAWDSKHSEYDDAGKKHSFAIDDRCYCADRVSFLIQCAREHAVDNEFTLSKRSTRWRNRRARNSNQSSNDLIESLDNVSIELNDAFDCDNDKSNFSTMPTCDAV